MTRTAPPLLAAAFMLCACAGAQTRFYTLEPTAPPVAPQAYAGAPFRIDAVHIPASLDRPELVRDESGTRFTVSDLDHWAAPVGELLRRTLTQDLAAQLPAGKIIYPDAPKLPGSGGLVVDILSISSADGGVAMQASWTLIPAQGAGRERAVRLTTPAVGAGVEGDAAELSALTGKLATAIAAELAQPPS